MIYITAVEWAMQTITTVGYGNVATVSTDEKVFVVFGMMAGAAIFSYVIGTSRFAVYVHGGVFALWRQFVARLRGLLVRPL